MLSLVNPIVEKLTPTPNDFGYSEKQFKVTDTYSVYVTLRDGYYLEVTLRVYGHIDGVYSDEDFILALASGIKLAMGIESTLSYNLSFERLVGTDYEQGYTYYSEYQLTTTFEYSYVREVKND